jgi:hypothetical protein
MCVLENMLRWFSSHKFNTTLLSTSADVRWNMKCYRACSGDAKTPFPHRQRTSHKFLIINSLSVIRRLAICINLCRIVIGEKPQKLENEENGRSSSRKRVELNLPCWNIHNWKVFTPSRICSFIYSSSTWWDISFLFTACYIVRLSKQMMEER